MTALLSANGLVRTYKDRRVLHGIDLHIAPGEILGIIGASGSGKSTLARILMGLHRPDEGCVKFRGTDFYAASAANRRAIRPHIQAVFQDPYGSLDPRWRVGRIVGEPLIATAIPKAEWPARVAEALAAVSLPADAAGRHPHAFSGGQRQRIAIARALVTRPALVIADEPVSALDVSVQAQVLNLFMGLRAQGMGCAFISHDLAVIRHIADRVLVLQEGKIVEQGPAALLDAPSHPFTARLIAAQPRAVAPC